MATLKADEFVGEFVEHFGVKGMRWGVRRSRAERAQAKAEKAEADKKVTVETRPGKKVKTSGGKGRTASEDAVNAAIGKQIAKKSGTYALSNDELKKVVERMNLEAQYTKLSKGQQGKGAKFLEKQMEQFEDQLLDDAASAIFRGKTKKK